MKIPEKYGDAIPVKVYGGATYIPFPYRGTHGNPAVDHNFRTHLLELPWLTKKTARHEYFMSLKPREYSYGNRGLGSESYQSNPFTSMVKTMMECLNEQFDVEMNVCFLNKYDDDHQHLGWHADQFQGMREDQPIIVVSYGAEREIWLKDKRGFLCNEEGFTKSPLGGKQPQDQRVKLEEGSLFIMPPGYQDAYLHRIPKHDRPCGWRISLTFRSFT
jgi:alkylated DNA repair dioxygenase AlkB